VIKNIQLLAEGRASIVSLFLGLGAYGSLLIRLFLME
jgi:hypothetical protein